MSGLERKEQSKDPALVNVLALLSYYFELGDEMPEQLVAQWLEFYPAHWIRLATIEALYRGRYKAVSVTQILEVWQRRTQVLKHFSYDFELLVCGNLPDALLERDLESAEEEPVLSSVPSSELPDASAIELEALDTLLDAQPAAVVTSGSMGGDLPPSAIHQFTPMTDRSDFYTRLKSIAEHSRDSSVLPVEEDDTKERSDD
jgi:hypothetical protein